MGSDPKGFLLSLDCCDDDYACEFIYAAASRKVIDRSCEALKEAVCFCFADPLDELVSDVSCLKVREDEDICLTCNR